MERKEKGADRWRDGEGWTDTGERKRDIETETDMDGETERHTNTDGEEE